MNGQLRRCFFGIILLGGLVGCAAEHQGAAPAPSAGAAPQPVVYDITAYGAIGDGKTKNTDAIQKAIDTCAAAGGGRVLIPAGTFLTGPINLASAVDLHLDKGAILLFSRNFDDYPMVYENFLGKDTVQCQSPITARNLHDVSITGPGIFDGQGDAWRPGKKWKYSDERWNALVKSGGVVDENQQEWYPTQAAMDGDKGLTRLRDSDEAPKMEDYAKYRDLLRPDLVTISACSNVIIDGPTFRNSGFWNLHLQWSKNITVRNVLIYNELFAQNGDGIGFDSCRDVLFENSTVYAGDDNISCKSGKDAQGRKRHIPTENVTIRHVITGWGHGGFVLGSETSGDIRNIHITDCACDGTDVGLRFKSVRGRGGVVEDVHVSNITMNNIQKTAILFDMYYEQDHSKPEPLSERTPCFRNFDLQNISCQSARQSILMHGLPELPMSQISFQNMKLTAETGALLSEVQNVTLKNVQIESKKTPALSTTDVWGLTLDKVDAVVNPQAPTTRPPGLLQ